MEFFEKYLFLAWYFSGAISVYVVLTGSNLTPECNVSAPMTEVEVIQLIETRHFMYNVLDQIELMLDESGVVYDKNKRGGLG